MIDRRRGFALLMVLAVSVVLLIVAAELATAARRRITATIEEARVMRMRWAVRSVADAVGPELRNVFADRAEASSSKEGPPPPWTEDVVFVGGNRLVLVAGDEDAKVDRRVVGRGGPGPTPGWWSDVDPGMADDPVAAGRDATLFGRGRLNLERASDAAIVAAVADVLGPAGGRRFLRRLRESPNASVPALLDAEIPIESRRRMLADRVGRESEVFSLAVAATSPSGRGQRELVVWRPDDAGGMVAERFAW